MEIKGFSYGANARRGMFRTEEGIKSQELLYSIGTNWVCLCFPIMQKTFTSTEIFFDYRHTSTDKDIAFAIENAHKHGQKVCLKPMVNCADRVWRAHIKFPETGNGGEQAYWTAWFESYTALLTHYAEIAEDSGAEMFCLGCEMLGTEHKEAFWRDTIRQVRDVYSGQLIYNTNHGKENVAQWYDAIDVLGTSAYYPLTGTDKASRIAEWEKIRDEKIRPFSQKWGKKVVFMEIGCRSAATCATMPWDFLHRDLPVDEQEQADFYDSCLTAFAGADDCFLGYFWWDWSTYIYDDRVVAGLDTGFNIHLKKAEEVVKRWYQK